ncbi:hypothetical protein BCR43DRAFT_513789 [Syncephalastrum racemosum]|uniref:Uncharacterized protein n=1 Tax=Syncephalastrum racemosum TaxID=13706 RepID=A0A1X2HEL6_SYNRA|nr:hypothetical protein BCR43DRAFT_513789 [Syncephalastrum racemosum]
MKDARPSAGDAVLLPSGSFPPGDDDITESNKAIIDDLDDERNELESMDKTDIDVTDINDYNRGTPFLSD